MRRSAVATIMLMAAGALLAARQVTFRTGVDVVNFGVTVFDKRGTYIADLTLQDFDIFEDGKKQELKYLARGKDPGESPALHLGLLFDTSGSMGEDIKFSRSAAIKFLNLLTDAVDMTLVDFDAEVRVARFGQADFPRLVERIRRREADGWTALYDALGVYLNGADGQDGRKILVVYTDGGDTHSSMSYSDALTLLKASDVTVYTVGLLEHQRASDKMDQRMHLQQIAEVTGGQSFFPGSTKDLDDAYAKVLAELRAQYTLGYTSTNQRADGAWRKVEIKLKHPDLKIRTRRGYFAPYKASSPVRERSPRANR